VRGTASGRGCGTTTENSGGPHPARRSKLTTEHASCRHVSPCSRAVTRWRGAGCAGPRGVAGTSSSGRSGHVRNVGGIPSPSSAWTPHNARLPRSLRAPCAITLDVAAASPCACSRTEVKIRHLHRIPRSDGPSQKHRLPLGGSRCVRGIYSDGWLARTIHRAPWEASNLRPLTSTTS